jgi:hydroxyacylglutathione hydrolase
MRFTASAALAVVLTCGLALIVPGSLVVYWDEGAANCKASSQPPLQVHPYNPQTFIMRENLCVTFEAPFIYLLIGSSRALLIDTGDVEEASRMPLAQTVMHLISQSASTQLPLLVVHTHRHKDHRAGDGQFANLPRVEVVGFDLESVRRYYHLSDWPNGFAQIELGDRTVDVIPTPGHNETEISFYDRNTALFFSGDFLMPGRLLIDDKNADLASANRTAAFVKDRSVSYVLGGHIEFNSEGKTFPWKSHFHPNEHILQLTKDDLLALPDAVSNFHGSSTQYGKFLMMKSWRVVF